MNKPEVPPVASAMPEALPSSTNRVVVQETAGRRDLGLNFTSRPGGDFDYGDIYGSVADRQGATAAHITANIGGIRYSGTAFQLDCYVLDVSQDGGDWDRVWIDGYEVAVAHEFGLATVPWSTSTTRWRHFRTAVIPQASRPTFADPGGDQLPRHDRRRGPAVLRRETRTCAPRRQSLSTSGSRRSPKTTIPPWSRRLSDASTS